MTEELAQKVEKTVKTAIKLADSLWREFKVHTAKNGLRHSKIVDDLLVART